MKQGILRCRKAALSITSLVLILLVFSLTVGIFLAFFDYNLSIHEQTRIDHERSQENIVLTGLERDQDPNYISKIFVRNTGTIEVRIRAIYTANRFICDPSTYMDTHITPIKTLAINLPSGVPFEPNATISVATERGIKTKESEALLYYGSPQPPWNYDPTKLYIGPLMLQFDAFWYRQTTQDGVLDPNDPWHPGWSIPKGFGYCAWNITVKNIDETRNITINRFSTFTAVPNDSPSNQLTWYLEPTNQTNYTQFLPINQTRNIIYIWSAPYDEEGTNSATKMVLPETTCMVFLTFFGLFHYPNGTTTTYAQTIPFEAAITVI